MESVEKWGFLTNGERDCAVPYSSILGNLRYISITLREKILSVRRENKI